MNYLSTNTSNNMVAHPVVLVMQVVTNTSYYIIGRISGFGTFSQTSHFFMRYMTIILLIHHCAMLIVVLRTDTALLIMRVHRLILLTISPRADVDNDVTRDKSIILPVTSPTASCSSPRCGNKSIAVSGNHLYTMRLPILQQLPRLPLPPSYYKGDLLVSLEKRVLTNCSDCGIVLI